MSRRRRVFVIAGLIGAALAAGSAPQASAFIYFPLDFALVHRLTLDGAPFGDLDTSGLFGQAPWAATSGDSAVLGAVAVDEHHLYWIGKATGGWFIGRARLDGTDLQPRFMSLPSAGFAARSGLAVDGQHIYWAARVLPGGEWWVSRANLDGTNVNETFIPMPGSNNRPTVAVDAHHIYWADGDLSRIGRADLDGSNVDQDFVTGERPGPVTFPGEDGVFDVAVDSQHVYWTQVYSNGGSADPSVSVGRSDLDGSNVNQHFLDSVSGHDYFSSLAVDGQHIYVTSTSCCASYLARANLDGSAFVQHWVAGGGEMALDGLGPPAPAPTPTPVPVATPGATPAPRSKTLSASKVFGLPSAKKCVSRRKFTIHIRQLPGITFTGASVKLKGKRVKTVKRERITAPVNLINLPKGRFVVSITATTSDGLTVTGKRTYHTCVPKRRSNGPAL